MEVVAEQTSPVVAIVTETNSIELHPHLLAEQIEKVKGFANTINKSIEKFGTEHMIALCQWRNAFCGIVGKMDTLQPGICNEPWVGETFHTIGQRIANLQHEERRRAA